MSLRLTLRALIAGTAVAAVVAGSAGTALAAPTHDQQTTNTLQKFIRTAQQAPGGVTAQSLTAAIDGYVGTNAWERGVDFQATDSFSPAFGTFSVVTGPDGTIGIATASLDGGCTLTTISGGVTTVWNLGDLGKNCSGTSALKGPNASIPWLDPVPPAAPTGLTAQAGESSVTLTWTAPGDTDLASYQIVEDGTVVATIPATGTGYTVTGLIDYQDYSFAVRAIDQAANVGPASTTAAATPIDLTPPGTPTNLAAVPGESQITLAWTASPDSDLAGYRVYQDGTQVADLAAGTTTYTAAELTDYQTYGFEVTAYDVHGNESTAIATSSAPIDLTAPGIPTNVTITPGESQVQVTFTGSPDGDLAGYRIYSDGALVATLPAGTTTGTITGLADYVDHAYTVTAYDVHGNESAPSDPAVGHAVDLTPPAAPTGLVGKAGTGTATLTWATNTEPDLASYRVYQNGTLVATVPAGTTTVTVPGLTNGTGYGFTITATDVHGNESAASDAVTVTPTAPPVANLPRPTGLSAPTFSGYFPTGTGGFTTPNLRFFWSYVPGVGGYSIQRSSDGGQTWVTVGTTPSATSYLFTDNSIAPNTTYVYRVAATSAAGVGPYSVQSPSVTTPDYNTGPTTPVDVFLTKTREIHTRWFTKVPAGSVYYSRLLYSTDGVKWTAGTTYTEYGMAPTEYWITGLQPDTNYYLALQTATSPNAWGAPSKTMLSGTGPINPYPVTATPATNGSNITLKWGSQPDAAGYEIQRTSVAPYYDPTHLVDYADVAGHDNTTFADTSWAPNQRSYVYDLFSYRYLPDGTKVMSDGYAVAATLPYLPPPLGG